MKKCLPVLLFVLLLSFSGRAQVTTSALEGLVVGAAGGAIPGATVVITHLPTGTRSGTQSDGGGQFLLNNLKPGGPYQVVVSFVGYTSQTRDELYLSLGKVTRQTFTLVEASTELAGVQVTGDKSDPFTADKNGQAYHLSQQAIRNTPTVNRSLGDLTKLMPQGNKNSFGGSNYRFNNLSIDGMATNDVLGFQEPASGAGGTVAAGTPGALAGTQPISLDAIDEISVVISPFNVTLGNFTGANINAVTKGGTNRLAGSAYSYARNQALTGKSVDGLRTPIESYYDVQSGLSLGGPIVKNKLFFFGNYELQRREEPVSYAPGAAGANVPREVARQISDFLQTQYGYDPGTVGDVAIKRNSDKFLLRLDYNISDKHRLSLRDNYVTGFADNLERSPTVLNFGNQGFRHHSRTNSLVAELKSSFTSRVSNQLIVGYNTVNENRTYDGPLFPHLEINYNTSTVIYAGTYREAAVYGSGLSTTQLTDNLTIFRDKHTLTLGTSNELNAIEYRFLTAFNGRWQYSSVDAFLNSRPNRVRGVYNTESNDPAYNKSLPSADFRAMLLSLYAQDDYRLSTRLTVQAGLRLDMQLHPDKVPLNPAVFKNPEFGQYQNKFGGVPQLNPRLSFNYQLNEASTMQLRGGSGLFTGRIPFVWYAYAHYISGNRYNNIDYRPTGALPIAQDLSTLQAVQPGIAEINLIDNDFKLPRDWKSTLAFDVKLPYELTFTAEGLVSKVVAGVLFQSINFKDNKATFEGADNRPYFAATGNAAKIDPAFTNVFVMSNTRQGYNYNATFTLTKRVADKLEAYAGYSYGQSKDIVNGVRVSPAANYEWNQALVANSPALAYSNFDLRHKFIGNLYYTLKVRERASLSASLIYIARSGSPYSYVYEGDVNRDGSAKNDVLFVPASSADITLANITGPGGAVLVSAQQQYEQLAAYIANDPYLASRRGRYAERNAARTPWTQQLDLRLTAKLPLTASGAQRLEVTFDVINLGNLLRNSWGRQYFVPNINNSGYALLDFVRIENNRPVYQFKNPAGTPWQTDPISSRWQGQLGLRYSFN
ncbi:TonB-dependent receptor [Hymenobacter chitinivorans]|uniref:Carboxypeptidase family protein n=1 Tax=Hymenobacter chitinivorans DSM 11115 TaxID=1121954 RepID=A0A2M9BNJ6_9BACT|nr:TonB-dependent receptor [Hymenobacter chitinivorans]PJJ59514.1 carboxypeptidase family protein [Hymenobacter chitinivorans DSM 11115]